MFPLHDYLPVFCELLFLKLFCKLVCQHWICVTIFDDKFAFVEFILDKKYPIEMCLEFPVQYLRLLFSILMALSLSWYNILSSILHSYAFKTFISQTICGTYSITPMTYDSVVILVFRFWFYYFTWTITRQNDIDHLMCPCILICNACAVYIHVMNFLK